MTSTTYRAPTMREFLEWMRTHREEEPIYYDRRQRAWHVFGYSDVERILSDHTVFSSSLASVFPTQSDLSRYAKGNFLVMDPPRHRKMRGIVGKTFTGRVVSRLEPRIELTATALLDTADGNAAVDFVEAVANPLPVIVIAELVGIPAADHSMFRSWANTLLDGEQSSSVRPDESSVAALAPAVREMNEYLLRHIRTRRREPQDDLISGLVRAEVDGQRLDDEIVGAVGLLLMAGHFTTTALLTNTVVCLDEHPDVDRLLREDQAAIPEAIDEILRLRPSFPRVTRRTTTDVELGGRRLGANELVIPWLASANRDAAKFPNPDAFEPHRRPRHHLSFGHGIHFCVGAPLAKLETATVLRTVFNRYGAVRIAREHEPAGAGPHPWEMVSIKRLPVVLAR